MKYLLIIALNVFYCSSGFSQVSGFLGKRHVLNANVNISPHFRNMTYLDESSFNEFDVYNREEKLNFAWNVNYKYILLRRFGVGLEYKQQPLSIYGKETEYWMYVGPGWDEVVADYIGISDLHAKSQFGFLNLSFSTEGNIQPIDWTFNLGLGFVSVTDVDSYLGRLTYHEPTTAYVPETIEILPNDRYTAAALKLDVSKSWPIGSFLMINASVSNVWIVGLVNSYQLRTYDFPFIGIFPFSNNNIYDQSQSFNQLGVDGDLIRHGIKQALSRQNFITLNLGISILL